MPLVSVQSRPKGLPMANTFVPPEVCAGADRNGGRALETDADFEHRDIVGRTHADQRGLVIAAVGQFDSGLRRP